MCMRFIWTVYNAQGFLTRLQIQKPIQTIKGRYNIAPTQNVPVIFNDHENHLEEAKWGMPIHWQNEQGIKPMYNARSETIDKKPVFKKYFEKQRCLMVADGFYEWTKPDKKPFLLELKTKETFAFAAIFAEKDGERSCCMVTTEPNEIVAPIHNRMPVILAAGTERAYLNASPEEAKKLLKPIPGRLMEAYEVNKKINGARYDSQELIEPAKKEKTLFDY